MVDTLLGNGKRYRRANIVLLFLLTALLGICEGAGPTNVYLLAGQSNMSGQGGIQRNGTWDGIVPPECVANPNIYRLSGNLTWEEAREPLHHVGVGPGMPFANTLLKLKPAMGTIGLVPRAIGGSPISSWEKGQAHYEALITGARTAASGGGVIKALLWYQGEFESFSVHLSPTYAATFDRFVIDVRNDLALSNLTVIQVAIASGGNYTNVIRAAQLKPRLPNVECVDAMGSELQWDNIHLTTHAQVLLGEKIAQHVFTNGH